MNPSYSGMPCSTYYLTITMMTTKNKDSLIRAGAEYIVAGFSVIPVIGKKPCVNWKQFQEKAMTVIEFQNLFERCEATGIAIVTGKLSGITVVDVDSEEANSKLHFPRTPTVKTSKGYHYYFKYTDKITTTSNPIEKVDIRSEGGYVVAPPSIHESGAEYTWLVELREEMAEFPIEKFKVEQKQAVSDFGDRNWESLFSGVPEGNRNTTATQIVGKFLRFTPQNEWERTIWPLLCSINKRNTPPLEAKELRQTFDSIVKTKLKSTEQKNEPDQTIKIISIKELFTKEQKLHSFLIKKLLPNKLNVMSGQPGAGKSWIMLEMAKAVATGSKLFEKYETVQGAVMIVDGESGEQELKKRMLQMGFDKDLPIYVISEQGIKLDNPETLKFLHSKAKELDIKFIIFDPFSAMHSKTENNAEDMQIVMESMASFTNQGITVLFLHHHRKESSFSPSSMSQNLRGSSVILSRVDSQTVIINKGDQGTTTRIRYSQEKLRNGKREKTFELFLDEDETGIYLKHAGEIEVENSKMDTAIDVIPKILKDEGKTKEEICQLLKKEDIQERTASMALRKLEKARTIQKTRRGKKNFYTVAQEEKF